MAILTMIIFAAGAAAQGLVVKKFYHAERDFTANSGSTRILDQNEEPCALIKVRTNERGFTFDAGRLLPIEKTEEQTQIHPLEIYVWVQSGVKRLSIGHKQLGNLYDYDLGTGLLPGQTYILELVTGEVQTIVKQARTQQYVVFELTPADAVVRLDGQMLKTMDGMAMKLMNFGTYQYTVEAPDHKQAVGRIEVNDPENKHVIKVSLKSNYTQVTLTAPGNAEIWVNDEKKGSGQWTGNLGEGAYLFVAKLPGHRDSQRSITLDLDAGPQTIALEAPTPIYGGADITSEPLMADIYIDGQKVGQTPQLISNLLVGTHSIKLSRDGYIDFTGSLTVKEGESATFNASLQKKDNLKELFEKGKALYDKTNYAAAVPLFKQAAEQGNTKAQHYLGYCYYYGRGVTEDNKEAVKWFRQAAEQGHAEAQYYLGWCYFSGLGVTEDKQEADKWYKKAITQFKQAAEQGDAEAQYKLGYCYYLGYGVTRDRQEADKWYKKAVTQFKQAAEQGDAEAQYKLGDCYYYGYGVTMDYTEAVKWYRKAAEQGDAEAQYKLGDCYYLGRGVTKDYTEAVKWWRKVAEQGHALAQYDLGRCYYYGRGVTEDKQEAKKWIQKAAEQGHSYAKNFLEKNKF